MQCGTVSREMPALYTSAQKSPCVAKSLQQAENPHVTGVKNQEQCTLMKLILTPFIYLQILQLHIIILPVIESSTI